MAGHVGQTALDRIGDGGLAAAAALDQHMAAVRSELAVCQRQPVTGRLLRARLAMLRSSTPRCPDVPFAADALQPEATVPANLLLHYACGFVEAALQDGWRPARSADAADWASLRLAAICKLITMAEAAAEVHPDLRAST